MTTISLIDKTPRYRLRWSRVVQRLLAPAAPADDPRRRRRSLGYRVALDDSSIAIYGYDPKRLSRISATLNLY